MMLNANAATLRGLTHSFCGLYNVVSGTYSVQNSPWGEGGLYPAQGLENYILHFCVIWGYDVQHLITQKVYKIET